MKKFFAATLLMIAGAVLFASCASSRKSGCPNNPQANYRFRG
ncbi:MAG TPA: hypothetical protein PKC69_12295 [Chitinophagaceae bacterium]|nr:hypothetical protein [Chitinophagaceae bacterium]